MSFVTHFIHIYVFLPHFFPLISVQILAKLSISMPIIHPSATLQITSFICLQEKKHKKVYLSLLYPSINVIIFYSFSVHKSPLLKAKVISISPFPHEVIY
jgi:hypothetical protein